MTDQERKEIAAWRAATEQTLDAGRASAIEKRHAKGFRSARENLADLCDQDSFNEYGQMAVAAQRGRIAADQIRTQTAGDGIITGTGSINGQYFSEDNSRCAIIINDYTVLAGTQGYFHHHKLDRILQQAKQQRLPVIMYTEGGGGRPGDTDVQTQIAGLNIPSFALWAELSGLVPRIAVNNGYCFAGNAALFGCADVTIATRQSYIGMAGPAMIEGGGLGSFHPREIGPIEVQSRNGVVDVVAEDEAHATQLAKALLAMVQGDVAAGPVADQQWLSQALPEDRRYAYPVRPIIECIADTHSFIELRAEDRRSIVTGFMRINGKPMGVLANDCRILGGAIDGAASEKAARFIQLCDHWRLPILSLCDTPGFMVGPDSEAQAAVRRMSRLFTAGASCTIPIVSIFLRKAYGLGAMAMTGGSFHRPVYSAAWPTGEFGAMGLEGAVHLGFKKELDATSSDEEREQLFEQLLAEMHRRGQATEAAAFLEIDAVINPADTRKHVLRALAAAGDDYKKQSARAFADPF